MKKIICKKEYDTDNASLLKKVAFGECGDTSGYEESLYQMESGSYFLYVNGGVNSIYPREDIKRMSEAKAKELLKAHE